MCIYIYIYIHILFICLFIYVFIYLYLYVYRGLSQESSADVSFRVQGSSQGVLVIARAGRRRGDAEEL